VGTGDRGAGGGAGRPTVVARCTRAVGRDSRTWRPGAAVDIRDLLDRLSPEHRAVLVLRDLEGLDEQTAGEQLGVPTGTVRSRLFWARRSFRKACQTEGGRR
jgi:DNA-directed RNA polymerase specialized sigma24 family protein